MLKRRTKIKAKAEKGATRELDSIQIQGAREHNLKNIDLELPKKKLIVITGVSGSGKSSLAFDTLFAEGQRRYVESLSAYARQFIGQMEKPKYDMIRGLSPTISIDQKAASRNPRSTVGTITEIYDYLRVLYARLGEQFCFECGKAVGRGHAQAMVTQILQMPEQTKLVLLAPIIEERKGEHRERLEKLKTDGFSRVRIDGVIHDLEDAPTLQKRKKHTVEVVVDRLVINAGAAFRKRLTDSVEQCLKFGSGRMVIHIPDREDVLMSEKRSCCGHAYPDLDPPLFSFNSHLGMCPECNGIGTLLAIDPDKVVPDKNLSVRQGAVLPLRNYFDPKKGSKDSWGVKQLRAMEKQWGLDYTKPWKKMSKRDREILLNGSKGAEFQVKWNSEKFKADVNMAWEGILPAMMRRYRHTQSDHQKKHYQSFMAERPCLTCQGHRLRKDVLHVRIEDQAICDVTAMTIGEAYDFIDSLKLAGNDKLIGEELVKEIANRLRFLINVGLDYLMLSRKGPTLSGGESQRIRLASQVGSELTGVLYILDEPSIGLHQRDNVRLLETLCHLRDIGNTLVVIEHDQETMESADWIVDMGPGAGLLGGQVVAEGTPASIKRNSASITGRYLSGKDTIPVPAKRRSPSEDSKRWITIKGASENNLADIDVGFPLSLLVAVTGVSGAGKSSLINKILYPALACSLHGSTDEVGEHKGIQGLSEIDKIINIDQSPIGRTPRSNPATYTKVFDEIRNIFSMLPESRVAGYQKGRFSFNVKGGRCEDCQGDGSIKVEMHFLANVYVPCKTCRGKRFNDATLAVMFKGHSIAQVLDLSVGQARELFENHPKISGILDTLIDVGLSYVKLGQSALTLSGGEAQRVKLARELAKRGTGRTLYLLDEPTTGLHFQDIQKLLSVLQRLVDAGNTVIVIEHNLDVIKVADWIIDLGPDGGNAGGRLVVEGPPESVARCSSSYTGAFLKEVL